MRQEVLRIAATDYRKSFNWTKLFLVILGTVCPHSRFKKGVINVLIVFFFSSRRRHTRFKCDWSSDVCSSDLTSRVKATAEELVTQGDLETLPTFFEHVTVIALLAFAEAKVEVAILETGLGGQIGRASCRERV